MVYEKIYKDGGNEIVFNVSAGLQNYSQRNNEYVKVHKNIVVNNMTTCNTTCVCMAASYAGWKFPNTPHPELKQEEDRLAAFCNEDQRVSDYYKKMNPVFWKDWQDGAKNAYPPNEVHDVLCYAANTWLGSTLLKFSTQTGIGGILSKIWRDGLPVILSGVIPSNSADSKPRLNHLVCLVGLIYREDNVRTFPEKYPDDSKLIRVDPTHVIIDDPYGNPVEGYEKHLSGNDVVIPWDKFIEWFKPVNNVTQKWAYIVNRGQAVV